MGHTSTLPTLAPPAQPQSGTLLRVLAAASFCHLLNDMVQSLLPSIYPILKSSFHLNFTQIGILTLTFQITASLLQPVIGHLGDRTPRPFALPIGMTFTLAGLLLLAVAPTFGWLIFAASLVGIGSAIFHPESSRIARMASGGRHGFAQSFFQVGGNAGSAIGPLLAAFIVLPRGQIGMAWFAIPALLAICILIWVGRWYRITHTNAAANKPPETTHHTHLSRGKIIGAIAVLIALIFSKYFYLASLTSYYTFYLINRFQVSVRTSQELLFLFLAAVAAGTLIGGPVGDRYGRKYVIWVSILGVLPFTLILPHANLLWTAILTVIIGFVLASAFSAILVYAQELVPGRVGMISGLFFGFAFGMGGIGAAVLGKVADATSITHVYQLCAYLPAIGLLTWLLPNLEPARKRQ
ncbi:MFS transporter [Tunturibacter empetritectus]|uniref:FSR family fosmidomycin resistance protein-like MFS transporter n=1 Tax=Tunturiibacter empetritectus TaxID=3069691 RepID=A0A7W8IEG0_9BACT|nr:MFS transporter [Edaphobacter lichenicola]MBB5315647.1 FSR family fosmidomycin resistance protein-like MFS transporter [Edaphobacter lichenicola]